MAFYHLILGRKKAGDLFQISCSVCRYVGGGYLIVKVRGKLTDVKLTNWKLFYLRSINPMIEKINPTIPIPITSSPIPDEQREIIMAKSSIAIPNPIFFIVNPPLQMPICCHLHYTSLAIEKIAYFMKLVGWEQLATQGVPRWQVHKRVAGGSQRRGSVASPV